MVVLGKNWLLLVIIAAAAAVEGAGDEPFALVCMHVPWSLVQAWSRPVIPTGRPLPEVVYLCTSCVFLANCMRAQEDYACSVLATSQGRPSHQGHLYCTCTYVSVVVLAIHTYKCLPEVNYDLTVRYIYIYIST